MSESLIDMFFPWQIDYLSDHSRVKMLEKSRRVGGTWTQSFEDVSDCIEKAGLKVYFSSADLTAASEYIDYCADWVNKLNGLAKLLPDIDQGDIIDIEFADEDKGVKCQIIEFLNGSKIIALSSNPKAFRSKGGKIVWDEAAHHEQDEKMWAAAMPSAMWGYDIRILSTHNGKKCVFYRLIEKVLKGELNFSLHTVTIVLAVSQGLADKIMGKKLTQKEREEWIEEEHSKCLSEDTWLQEYMCQAQEEANAVLAYNAIDNASKAGILKKLSDCMGPFFVGVDVARRRHLTVIYVLEDVGTILTVRALKALPRMDWTSQETILYKILDNSKVVRCCIDRTGLGDQFTERAQNYGGAWRVEGITFSNSLKADLAMRLEREFQDNTIIIPTDTGVKVALTNAKKKDKEEVKTVTLESIQRESLHSVRKMTTSAGNSRYDAEETDKGHGDCFWALALAVHAARDPESGLPFADSRNGNTDKEDDFLRHKDESFFETPDWNNL